MRIRRDVGMAVAGACLGIALVLSGCAAKDANEGSTDTAVETIEQERSEATERVANARNTNYGRMIDAGLTPDQSDVACEWLMASGIAEVEPMVFDGHTIVLDCGDGVVTYVEFDDNGEFTDFGYDQADSYFAEHPELAPESLAVDDSVETVEGVTEVFEDEVAE